MKNKQTEQIPRTSQTNDNKQSVITPVILKESKSCSKCGMVHSGECR